MNKNTGDMSVMPGTLEAHEVVELRIYAIRELLTDLLMLVRGHPEIPLDRAGRVVALEHLHKRTSEASSALSDIRRSQGVAGVDDFGEVVDLKEPGK